MFNIFRKTKYHEASTTIILKLSGLHCSSCALNIDSTLEELDGIVESNTNYAKSESKVTFDDQKTSVENIIKIIEQAGYTAILKPSII